MDNNPIITYSISGGRLNLNNTYEIFEDGRVLTSTIMGGQNISLQSSLSRQKIEGLLELFDANGFVSMKGNYSPEINLSLSMTRQLKYRAKTVTATNGGNPPPEFQNIVEGIEALVR